jgi:hypothetical protein
MDFDFFNNLKLEYTANITKIHILGCVTTIISTHAHFQYFLKGAEYSKM